jgi:hypothetical protein
MRTTAPVLCGLLLAASSAACKKDSKETSTTTVAAPALDVAVTPSGEAKVSLSDETGQPVSTKGVTGHIELANGSNVTLTPDSEGLALRAPLGEMTATSNRDCMARMHVTMPSGAKRTQSVNLCREGRMNGHEGHAGHDQQAAGGNNGGAKSVAPAAMKDMGADMKGMGATMKDTGMTAMGDEMTKMGDEMIAMAGMDHGSMAGSAGAPMGSNAKAMGMRIKAMGAKMKDEAAKLKGMADSKAGKPPAMKPDDMIEMGMGMMEMGDMMEMGMGGAKDPMADPKSAPMADPKPAPMEHSGGDM